MTATAPASPAAKTDTDAATPPNKPVITIHGLCSGAPAAKNTSPAGSCTTVISRQQFDAVVNGLNAIGPPLLPAQRQAVAEGYANTLVNYEAARKAGVERDPRYAEVMRLARMRAMGDMYNALLLEKARKVSPQQIDAYYKSNVDKFEELTLRRITLPRYNSSNLKDEAFAAKAQSEAAEIHDRAAKGEDPDALQKDAFDALGVKDPPKTQMGPVRRGIYAEDQEKQLFALKPGEVTSIIEQPSALIMFKLEKRETLTLDQAKDEIVRTLVKQNMAKEEQARKSSVQIEYDEKYLGPLSSDWMPASQLNAGPAKKAASSNAPKSAPPK